MFFLVHLYKFIIFNVIKIHSHFFNFLLVGLAVVVDAVVAAVVVAAVVAAFISIN